MDTTPLSAEERRFAEEHHNLVYAFMRKKDLSEEIFYDVIVFGYLKAVHQYYSNARLQKYHFSTLAWKWMAGAVANHYRYIASPKRCAPTISLDEQIGHGDRLYWSDVIGRKDEAMLDFETDLLLHSLAVKLPPREMRIIRMKVRGDGMSTIAKAEHLTFRAIKELLDNLRDVVVSELYG